MSGIFTRRIDPRAAMALVPHLDSQWYIEPCAGAGHLIDLLAVHGQTCQLAFDIEPQVQCGRDDIHRLDALAFDGKHKGVQFMMPIITNPPWDRTILHALIDHLSRLGPTWLLFDAAWKETKQAARFGPVCVKIVSVGRLKWVADSPHQSTDDCSWYLFDARHDGRPTEYHWPSCNRDPSPRLL